jgi:hypothetical protein
VILQETFSCKKYFHETRIWDGVLYVARATFFTKMAEKAAFIAYWPPPKSHLKQVRKPLLHPPKSHFCTPKKPLLEK